MYYGLRSVFLSLWVLLLGQVAYCADDSDLKSGRWTKNEHSKFLEAYGLFDKDWKKIAEFVETRNNVQCRTHAQKYFKKLKNIAKLSPARGKATSDKMAIKGQTLPKSTSEGACEDADDFADDDTGADDDDTDAGGADTQEWPTQFMPQFPLYTLSRLDSAMLPGFIPGTPIQPISAGVYSLVYLPPLSPLFIGLPVYRRAESMPIPVDAPNRLSRSTSSQSKSNPDKEE